MKFNICMIKPDGYPHSAAFTELADLIHYTLLDIGHTSTISVNNTFPDARNIIIGCHLLNPQLIAHIPRSSIILNTEQIYRDDTAWNENIFEWVSHFETWDYSEKNILKLKEIGIGTAKLLQIGYHPRLARISKLPMQDIDVLFYGSVNDRRASVLTGLQAAGLKVKAVFGVYGNERDQLIASSKVVLNLHYYNSKIFEIVRTFYLMTNSKAVVSEVDKDTSIADFYREGIYPSEYEHLVESCQKLIEDNTTRELVEKRALEAISKLPQKEFLLPLLDSSNNP